MKSKQYSIAIFGSADAKLSKKFQILATDIGAYLAKKKAKVVTGGCLGITEYVIKSAKNAGARTEAYFPDHDPLSHSKRLDNLNLKYFDTYHFIPGFTDRSLTMIKKVDAAIVLNGRIGTLSEFTIAIEEGLPVAVIKNSGGISDELERIIKIAKKEFSSKIIFEKNFKKAIDDLIDYLKTK